MTAENRELNDNKAANIHGAKGSGVIEQSERGKTAAAKEAQIAAEVDLHHILTTYGEPVTDPENQEETKKKKKNEPKVHFLIKKSCP